MFDATLPPIVTIKSGDLVSFPNTWSHFMNEIKPGVPVQPSGRIAQEQSRQGAALDHRPDRGQGCRTGRCGWRCAIERLRPVTWGAVFNNPGALGTGLLPRILARTNQIPRSRLGQDAGAFGPAASPCPLKPFQGTLGVAPARQGFPPLRPGVTSSVPPGPHAGDVDLRGRVGRVGIVTFRYGSPAG